MNPFEMVLGIVLIVTIGRVFVSRSRRDRIEAGDANRIDPDAAQLKNEVRQLKERIAVLERLITDNNSAINLDREIEKLR